MRVSERKRRGLTAIVAEVVLIGVLLIASFMLIGFTFGVFSFYYPPAEVAVDEASCLASGNTTTCNLMLTNDGSRSTATTGVCSINAGGDVSGSVLGGGVVPAGGSLPVQCVAHGGDLSPGSQVSGALTLTNGGSAFFIGTLE